MGFGGGTLLRLRLLALAFKAIFRGMALLATEFTLFRRIIIIIVVVVIKLTLCWQIPKVLTGPLKRNRAVVHLLKRYKLLQGVAVAVVEITLKYCK